MLITLIFNNLVLSAENFAERIASERDLWLLQRIALRMDHSRVDVRKNAFTFVTNLVNELTGNHRDFILERLDVTRSCLYVLSRETVPAMVLMNLSLLEYSLHLDSGKLSYQSL